MEQPITIRFGTSPMVGDDGEAIPESPKITLPEPSDLGWYVAVVRVNCERRIAEDMEKEFARDNLYFDYWVAMEKYPARRKGKRVVAEKVSLTTFVFVHVGRSNLNKVRFRSDVYKILSMPGKKEPYRIPDTEFNGYRCLVDNDEAIVTLLNTPLKKGARVRILDGFLKGCEAIVQKVSGKTAIIGNEIKYISGAVIRIDKDRLAYI